MGWKDWPYWLKGGIMGGIIGSLFIILLYLIYLIAQFTNSVIVEMIIEVIFNCLGLWIDVLSKGIGFFDGGTFRKSYLDDLIVLYLIIGSICGTLIGFLYGKFKNRKKGAEK